MSQFNVQPSVARCGGLLSRLIGVIHLMRAACCL